jgi:hypothetical protein
MAAGRSARAVAGALLALVLAGCGGDVRDDAGRVTAAATTDTFSVRVGDCLGKLPTESTAELSLLPCAEPHYWEAFATAMLTGDDFPGAAAVRNQAEDECTRAFAGFVGVAANKSKLELTMLTPTKETWTQANDREVVCLVGSPSGGVTGTLKDAAR